MGEVAQVVERLVVSQPVVGSTPTFPPFIVA